VTSDKTLTDEQEEEAAKEEKDATSPFRYGGVKTQAELLQDRSPFINGTTTNPNDPDGDGDDDDDKDDDDDDNNDDDDWELGEEEEEEEDNWNETADYPQNPNNQQSQWTTTSASATLDDNGIQWGGGSLASCYNSVACPQPLPAPDLTASGPTAPAQPFSAPGAKKLAL
jgi:hypothetical protein